MRGSRSISRVRPWPARCPVAGPKARNSTSNRRCPVGDSRKIGISATAELAPYLAAKGSITVDGVSLTVNEVSDQPDGTCHFSLNIIPHTAEVTTLGGLEQGSKVNLEIDVLARYLKRMQSLRG